MAAIGTDAGRLGLILGAIVNQDQLACPKTAGGLVGALASDIFDGVFDGKKSGTAVTYCGGKLTAIAGNAQSSDALSGLQQLTLSTRGFSFGGAGNALTLNGVDGGRGNRGCCDNRERAGGHSTAFGQHFRGHHALDECRA